MATREVSIGPLYLAPVRLKLDAPPHTAQIIEMAPPWRRGKALLLRVWWTYGVAVGIWRPAPNSEIDEELENEQWMDPGVLDVTMGEIATWSNGEEEDPAEAAARV